MCLLQVMKQLDPIKEKLSEVAKGRVAEELRIIENHLYN